MPMEELIATAHDVTGSRVLDVPEHPKEAPSRELRRRLLDRWRIEGGHVLESGSTTAGPMGGWTSGPVTQ